MLLIGFNQAAPASTLVNYLNAKDIPCRLVESNQKFQIYLSSEDDYSDAVDVLKRFMQAPNHPDFTDAAWKQGSPANVVYASAFNWQNVLLQMRHVPLTTTILATTLTVYILVFALGQFHIFDNLAFQPLHRVIENGNIWRLITPTVIHFSIFHLAFNLAWWFMLGRDIEEKLGVWVLLLLYLIIGLTSNYAQFLDTGVNFGGLSGVVYGLLGFCWWLGWIKPGLGVSVSKPLVGFMILWLAIGYLDLFWFSIANTAHLVGLLSGCCLALAYILFLKLRKGQD